METKLHLPRKHSSRLVRGLCMVFAVPVMEVNVRRDCQAMPSRAASNTSRDPSKNYAACIVEYGARIYKDREFG